MSFEGLRRRVLPLGRSVVAVFSAGDLRDAAKLAFLPPRSCGKCPHVSWERSGSWSWSTGWPPAWLSADVTTLEDVVHDDEYLAVRPGDDGGSAILSAVQRWRSWPSTGERRNERRGDGAVGARWLEFRSDWLRGGGVIELW
jgi:hypothetical protein